MSAVSVRISKPEVVVGEHVEEVAVRVVRARPKHIS